MILSIKTYLDEDSKINQIRFHLVLVNQISIYDAFYRPGFQKIFHRKHCRVFASKHADEPFKYLDKLFKFLAELFKYFTKLFKHSVDHLKPEEKIKNSSKSFKSRLFDRLSVYVITWSMPSQLATIFKGHVSVIFLQLPHCLCFN